MNSHQRRKRRRKHDRLIDSLISRGVGVWDKNGRIIPKYLEVGCKWFNTTEGVTCVWDGAKWVRQC
jgi:hypothetical protein